MTDPYPSFEFDAWAETYDQDVADGDFPFTGYGQTLKTAVEAACAGPEMKILDIGTGTGNLASLFLNQGCRVTATDFSAAMLEKARGRLPGAELIQADLRQEFPPEMQDQQFDRIVSAYVFHHFDLAEKVTILLRLAEFLPSGGRIVVADISFPTRAALEAVKRDAGNAWEDEFYWIAAEAVPALEEAGFTVRYKQVSSCAGVYVVEQSGR